MNLPVDRFRKLNNVLGWGNPKAKIIYIGIEEAGNWSILGILDAFIKQDILQVNEVDKIKELLRNEKISIEKYFNIVDLILKYNNSKGLLECLNEYLEYYCSSVTLLGIRTANDNESIDLCPLENFQYYITKRIIERDISYSVCEGNYDHTMFGKNCGNELCLNFYPIGRSTMKINYPEYNEFFGLVGQERFPNLDLTNERLENMREFILERTNTAEKLLVITLGEQDTFKDFFIGLFKDMKIPKPFYFEKKGRGQSYYHYVINLSLIHI